MITSDILNARCPYAMPEELAWIRQHVATLPDDACVVMIGAGPGVMALACFEGNPQLYLLHVAELTTVAWLLKHLESAGVDPTRVVSHQGYSWDVGDEWPPDVKVHFLIVDGDHSFEAVSKDIEAWVPHMKEGGSIFFHDCLERPGGFLGEGDWEPSGVWRAILQADLRPTEAFGISVVCKV